MRSEDRHRVGPEPGRWWSSGMVLFSALTVASLISLLVRFPGAMQFDAFSFSDTGANLTAQYLLDHGYRPLLDFS